MRRAFNKCKMVISPSLTNCFRKFERTIVSNINDGKGTKPSRGFRRFSDWPSCSSESDGVNDASVHSCSEGSTQPSCETPTNNHPHHMSCAKTKSQRLVEGCLEDGDSFQQERRKKIKIMNPAYLKVRNVTQDPLEEDTWVVESCPASKHVL